MAVKIKRSNPLGELNLTPVIDMVFLLLIFFLVAARIEEEDARSLEVKLPQASEAMPLTSRPRELHVTVSSQGRYYAGGRFCDLAQLEQLLLQAAADNPGRQTVIIRADERCPWRFVVNVMNLCARARIRDVRTMTEPVTSGPAAH